MKPTPDKDARIKTKIYESLNSMKEEAMEKRLMFQHTGLHKEVRMSPYQLDLKNTNGKFLWGPPNWRLEEPTLEEERLFPPRSPKEAAKALKEMV